jgi:kinesin family protein C1
LFSRLGGRVFALRHFCRVSLLFININGPFYFLLPSFQAEFETRLQDCTETMEAVISEKQTLGEQNIQLRSELQTLRRDSMVPAESPQLLANFTRVNAEAEILRKKIADMEMLRGKVADHQSIIADLEKRVQEGESLRRKMHNTIQELRGNVRVFARIRPFLPNDNESEYNGTRPVGDGLGVDVPAVGGKDDTVTGHNFKFDKVFAPSDGQETVFREVQEFVQSALDGFNVCLFSYGQTGSGKTHTMQGSGNGPMRGIIARSIETVIQQSQALGDQGWKYQMNVTFVEIYNETIRDLLAKVGAQKHSKIENRTAPVFRLGKR